MLAAKHAKDAHVFKNQNAELCLIESSSVVMR